MAEAKKIRPSELSLIIGFSSLIMAFILALILAFTIRKLRILTSKYNTFMKGADGKSLESAMLTTKKDIENLKKESDFSTNKLNIACETIVNSFQKMSIVKYDAFKEMGGKLSFSVALLDDKNTGFILSSVHASEGCYTYIKEIIKGESFVVLSDEERTALEEAKARKNLMIE